MSRSGNCSNCEESQYNEGGDSYEHDYDDMMSVSVDNLHSNAWLKKVVFAPGIANVAESSPSMKLPQLIVERLRGVGRPNDAVPGAKDTPTQHLLIVLPAIHHQPLCLTCD